MKVTFEHSDLEQCPAPRLEIVSRAFEAHVNGIDTVSLIATGDFTRSVIERRAGTEGYDTDRLFGEAVAKTISRDDGSYVVLLNDRQLCHELSNQNLEHLLRHEASHVGVAQRGETLSDLQERHGIKGFSTAGTFAAFSGFAAEEYRVERAALDRGPGLNPPHVDSVHDGLATVRLEVEEALVRHADPSELLQCTERVLTAFHRLTMMAAYIAAADLSTSGRLAPQPAALRGTFMPPNIYESYRDSLGDIPAADKPTPRAELDRLTLELNPLLEQWLETVGFAIWDEGEGMYFDVRYG